MMLGYQRRYRRSILRGEDWPEEKNAGHTEKYFDRRLSQHAILAAFYIEGRIMSRGEWEAMELMFRPEMPWKYFCRALSQSAFLGTFIYEGQKLLCSGGLATPVHEFRIGGKQKQ
jgi:hypothetical protein